MSDKINDLIAEARFYESPGHVAAYAEGTLELLRKLADALEATLTVPDGEVREKLRAALLPVTCNVSNYPRFAQAALLGSDLTELNERIEDAILTAFPILSRAAVPDAATREPSENDREAASVHEITVATVAFAKSLVGEGADHEDHDYYRKHIGVALDAVARAAVPDAATRQPSKDDREALAKIMFDAYADGIGKPFEDEARGIRGLYLEQADAVLAAGFSRATVPDAATEGKQPEGWSNEDAHAAADQAFARWSTHDERDVWNRNGFRLGAEWQKARETFISFKVIADEARAERDAALAAVERVRAIHRNAGPSQGYSSDIKGGYGMLDDCCSECGSHGEYGVEWPCPTVAALDVAPEPEGQRWFAACWRDDNGILNSLESATVVREYAEADVKRWRDQEQRETDGQPDRVVLASKISYPWLPVEGESHECEVR